MLNNIIGNIAIDGPAGAGKSTVARLLAQHLGYIYIDTGAMYRAVTWKALEKGINLADHQAVTSLTEQVNIELKNTPDGGTAVYCDGREITREIRKNYISQHVSTVASIPGVRQHLVQLQRRLASCNRVVMDGRDIGTHVLPEAPYKFFLIASLEERARRRYSELNKGCIDNKDNIREIMNEIELRDKQDSRREMSPLKPAEDSIIIDTTNMPVEQVVSTILNIIISSR